jgi:hypothetical protein
VSVVVVVGKVRTVDVLQRVERVVVMLLVMLLVLDLRQVLVGG